MKNEFGIDLEDAKNELATIIEEAHSFITSEFEEDWSTSELYFAGQTDMPTEEGRSKVVKTESRDIIRALMPNVMRVLLQSRKPVIYTPASIMTAAFAEQQSHFVAQLFYRCGGYRVLYDAIMESFKMKAGPMKVYWLENPDPEHIYATGLTAEEALAYQDEPDVIVDEVEEVQDPTSGELTYNLRATKYYQNGKICLEAVPMYEFFVQRNASNLENFVHGHRRTVTVGEAIEMGIEYDNWRELDNDNPEENEAVEAASIRRGYVPDKGDLNDADILNMEFLLSEAYCWYDLDGDGVSERYVFYYGGTSYKYLHHERVEDFAMDLICHDPMPFAVIGRSIIDITKQSQDVETAILRSVVDNALIANNPRPAADPTKTNFQDLMNNVIGAPIRTKGSPDISYVDVPFTAQQLLPFLQYLEQDAQMRVGVTKAAAGLDPDAMQSTDKNAVLNTIQLSQGQVELIVRNIIETGLIPLFRKILRLSMRHMDKLQVMRYKGGFVPVDISRFDPFLVAEPNVGIGTTSPEQKLATLQFILAKQEAYMDRLGFDNPFTSMSQLYNTLEDIVELGGLPNPGRYFNYIDRRAEEVIAKRMSEQAAADAERQMQMQPIDPGRSLMMTESMKTRAKMQEIMIDARTKQLELQQRALEKAEEFDIRRDELAQQRVINLAKIGQERQNEAIRSEQASNSPRPQGGRSPATAGEQP